MKYLYETILTPNEQGGYDVFIPDFDVVTQGEDIKDAVDSAADLLYTLIPALLSEGDTLPDASFEHEIEDGSMAMGVMVVCDENTPEEEYMSVQNAADIIGVSKPRVYAMVRDGVLDSSKVGSSVLVATSSVRDRANGKHPVGRPRKRTLV